MKYLVKTAVAMCALTVFGVCGSALSEEMPVVVDQPLAQADAGAPSEDETARLKRAQQMLIDFGYLAGGADGIYGPQTAKALLAFQRENGLVATGTLDDTTLLALQTRADAVNDVKALQQRLIDLGYLTGSADGIFGERSAGALTLFQSMNGIDATGEADEVTRKALFDEAAEALPAQLASGDEGEGVVRLQEKLIQLGFLGAEVDGKYGKKTAAAVKRFQEHLIGQEVLPAQSVVANGRATPVTQAMLFDAEYSTYIYDLSPDDRGSEVQRVERRLIGLGYMDMPEDERFDDYAISAARAFQAAAGLGQDQFDRRFIEALFSEDAPRAERFVPHDISEGDSGLAVREAEQALVRGGMTVKLPNGRYDASLSSAVTRLHDYLKGKGSSDAALFANAASLSIEAQQRLTDGLLDDASDETGENMASEDVKRVQRRLHTLYYLSRAGIDGRFGSKTVEALESFQQMSALPVTGEADEATRAALFSDGAEYSLRPYRVEVDIGRQRVYVYQLLDDGEYERIKTFVCSTGVKDSTPRGIYLDGFPCNEWHYFKKFDCWAQYSYEIEGDIMFHSVLYSEKDEKSLRTGSLNALGTTASHGCIRLEVDDAKWLYKNCKRGSLVILIY